MNQWRPVTIGIALAAIAGFSVYGCCGLTRVAYVTIEKWGDAAPSKAQVSGILDSSNAVLGKANLAVANLADATGDWSDASKQQARDVRALLSAAGRTLDKFTETGEAAKTTLAALAGTANALTGTANQATETAKAAQPLLASLTKTVTVAGVAAASLDSRLRDPHIDALMQHIAGMTASGDGILADGKKVADKATADFLKPVPWYMQPVKRGGELIDIGAAIARHTP